MTVPWLKQEVGGSFILTLHIQPGAKKQKPSASTVTR